MRNAILAIIAILTTLAASAQEAPYKYDFGGGIGMSGYLGDVNDANMFRRPGVTGNLQFRYIPNTRWAVRTQASVSTLRGDSRDYDIVYPGGESFSFSSTVAALDCRLECNFLPYGIGETYKRLRRFTPFIAIGLGGTLASCDGVSVALHMPLTAGVKYKLSERWNMQAEFTMAKVFGDKVDGLVDLYNIKSSFGKNTDWTSAIMVSVTYEFGKRCETCHRID